MKSTLAGYAQGLTRIIIGFLFSCHGFEKILASFGGIRAGTGGGAAFLSFV